MSLRIVRRDGEGLRITCGTETIYIVVAKTTEAKCVLDCTGPRSMRVERIEIGDGNDYRQTARGPHARPRIK